MSRKRNISKAKNMFFNIKEPMKNSVFNGGDPVKNLKYYPVPAQLQRYKQDIASWREAISEAERAYYPYRVKMQRMFIDTVLDGHVYALMQRRKDLTLLREFAFVGKDGEDIEELGDEFKTLTWFYDFMEYALDALFFGYSLISLGDVENGKINGVELVPRWWVSPDRLEVATTTYGPSGAPFMENPYAPWHVYVKTKSDHGQSLCGYGLFYQIARYEIYLRNTLGANADFVDLFAQPYRVGKTTKTTEAERAELEAAIQQMGSSGWALIDPMDEISFLETSMAGTGYKSYESLETRCQKVVSKIILGHSDAVDSTPGKLGAGQGGASKDGTNMDGSPVQMALSDKASRDGRFIETLINDIFLPKYNALPVDLKVPDGVRFRFKNGNEEEEMRAREDHSNLITAQIAQTMKSAGLQMDAAYFEERTGIKSEKIEMPDPMAKPGEKLSDNVKNRLKKIYEHHRHD
jgi:Protein of unknown function (DUF935)